MNEAFVVEDVSMNRGPVRLGGPVALFKDRTDAVVWLSTDGGNEPHAVYTITPVLTRRNDFIIVDRTRILA